MKKLLAMLLAAAMTIGTASVAFADDGDLFAIGNKTYPTLGAAVEAASGMEGTVTIRMLDNASGGGVKVEDGASIVFDFGGYTYTVGAPTVGSTGTETNGFQLLRGSNVTMCNGTVMAGNYEKLKILIQNYSDLTLENVTLDARKDPQCQYVASNNFGSLNVIGNTNIYAQDGEKAFDVYYWPDNGYGDGVTVTINTTGEIVGDVEYGSDGTESGKANVAKKAVLKVENGKIDGAISTAKLGSEGANVDVTGGIFTSDTTWTDYTKNAEVKAELQKDGVTEAYWYGPASKTIDASDYDGVVVTKAASNAVKVAGSDVEVTNGMDTPLSVNGTSIKGGEVIIVTREPAERDTTGGDYFGNEKWAKVKREIAAAEEGDTIEMSATGLPWFPSSVARALKGRDITLEVRKNGVTYSINGLEIGAIEKIWYEFDQIDTELLTVEAE